MSFLRPVIRNSRAVSFVESQVRTMSGSPAVNPSRKGKSSEAAGSIRSTRGDFGEQSVAREEQFFHNLDVEQMKQLKTGLTQEITFHEEQIKQHQLAIKNHKQRVDFIETH